ncbi:hypothetical protein DBR19_13680 [Aeromonas sp. HMWF014]|nr:hypothetical protein DBR19_13680 [Aeromonas sp. HMWF014]
MPLAITRATDKPAESAEEVLRQSEAGFGERSKMPLSGVLAITVLALSATGGVVITITFFERII